MFFILNHINKNFIIILNNVFKWHLNVCYISDELAKETEDSNVVVKKLDLSSQKSIREFSEELIKTETKLDVLIHNAGTAETRTKVTEDGLELTMATNYFGPFLLTHLLLGNCLVFVFPCI